MENLSRIPSTNVLGGSGSFDNQPNGDQVNESDIVFKGIESTIRKTKEHSGTIPI